MLFAISFSFLILTGLFTAAFYTWHHSRRIEKQFPALGDFVIVNNLKVHYVDRPADQKDAPVVVFLHGASGNLRDPVFAFGDRLNGKVRQIFLDRPGHGWSERASGMETPDAQAKHVIAALDQLNVEQAVFVGHSWSGTLVAALALSFPERVSGLLFSSPVSFPWPGGINWYYSVTAVPFLGRLFTVLFTLPVGMKLLDCATDKVFWPNAVPENYARNVGAELVLTPHRFHANALDIARLRPQVVAMAPRYHEIKVPAVVITGDKDQIVLPWVHTDGLERDVANIKVIRLKNMGHMPHHIVPDLFVEEILKLANVPKQAIAAE